MSSAKISAKSFSSPDEVRTFENSCQAPHTSYIISGRIKTRMDDGTEIEGGPGDTAVIPPGHDSWVVGDEPCILIDFTGMKDFAKKV